MSQCPSVDSLNFFITQHPIIEYQVSYGNQIKGESIFKVKNIRVLCKYPILSLTKLVIYRQLFWFFFCLSVQSGLIRQ